MAIITIDRKTFEKEIGKLDEKMKERIDMFGTPIENLNETEVQLEIFANRPDMLSYQGFKRSFLGFIGKKSGIEKYKINNSGKEYQVIIDQSVKSVRPFTACGIIKNLKLNDEKIREIIEIQEKIHSTVGRKRKKVAIGIYPLDKIKFPVTFKALPANEIKFIPLGEKRELNGLEILKEHPKGKEYGDLLLNTRSFPVFLDSNNKILSMPPIINSEESGKVDIKTKDLFIECSGTDFEILSKCLNIIVTALADMGGEIHQIELIYKEGLKPNTKKLTPNLENSKIKISLEKVNKMLGLEIDEKTLKNLLEKMRHNYSNGEVEYPAYRNDILHEIDIIEDVAIAYGYENFIDEIPSISTTGKESNHEIIKRKISEILIGLKFIEVSNYHLSILEDQTKKMCNNESGIINIKSSKTEYNTLRRDLSHFIMKIFSENIDAEYPQSIFEVGRVFEEESGEIKEKDNLSIGISPGNYTDLRKIVEYLFKMLNLNIELIESNNRPWTIQGRTVEIKLDKKIIGYIGEIHPKILKNWKIKMPVALMEISLEEIINKF